MTLTNDTVASLVPSGDPLREGILPRRLVAISESFDDDLLRRSFLWAAAIELIFWEQNGMRYWPNFFCASAGLVPVVEGSSFNDDNNNYVFGMVVSLCQSKNSPVVSKELNIAIGGESFPLIIREIIPEYHFSLPKLPNAQTTCWASSCKPSLINNDKGILTAGHAVSTVTIGQTLPANVNGSIIDATLESIGPNNIDAAFLSVDSQYYHASTSTLSVCPAVAPGLDVSFETIGQTSPINAKVTHSTIHSYYFGSLNPHLVFLDKSGQSGDSGVLIVDSNKSGVGIYEGSVLNTKGLHEGYCQHLNQVKYYLGLDLFV